MREHSEENAERGKLLLAALAKIRDPSTALGMTGGEGAFLIQACRLGILTLEFQDHAADVAITLVGLEQAQAFI